MRLAGDIGLPASRAALWEALADPVGLGAALPGVERVEGGRDGTVRVRARPLTGVGATPFDLTLHVTDRREPEHATIEGHGRGGESHVGLMVELDLRDDGDGSAVAWTAVVVVCGLLGSVAQRVLPSLAREQIESVLRAAAAWQAPARATSGGQNP